MLFLFTSDFSHHFSLMLVTGRTSYCKKSGCNISQKRFLGTWSKQKVKVVTLMVVMVAAAAAALIE